MNNLSHFLATESSEFGAELGQTGGYIRFSNSGKRGGSKSFHIGLESLAKTLQDICDHIGEFVPSYEEKPWRDAGAKFFTDGVANATITVQTKPLFSTLSKLIKWANPDKYAGIDADSFIVLTEEALSKTICDLKVIIDSYSPRERALGKSSSSRQTIFFGTPGSGKSHKVDEQTKGKKVHRTTFHPDSDYASFVGCYKPVSRSEREPIYSYEELLEKAKEVQGETYPVTKFFAKYSDSIDSLSSEDKRNIRDAVKGKKSEGDVDLNTGLQLGRYMREQLVRSDSSISYEFIPQVFTEAYIDAWKNLEEDVYLVIEEINRGNCAQIFGDLFQLLDRNSDGYSDYRITADRDLRDYLARELGPDHKGIQEGKLCLPPNLHILATMNTSDQSLFPMDSAFKRRWDWEYVPVEYRESVLSSSFTITLGDKAYRWVDFLRKVNELILEVTDSEDKQMGNFFIKRSVSKEEFKSKVMFYLWSEVCRDEYGTKNNFFRSKTGNEEREFSFNDLYKEEDEGLGLLHGFMDYLEGKAKNENEGIAEGETTDEQ